MSLQLQQKLIIFGPERDGKKGAYLIFSRSFEGEK